MDGGFELEEKRQLRRERKAEQARNEILSACVRVLSAKGLSGTTMEEVAREAGYATGSLYNYFPSKDDLLIAVCDQVHEYMIDVLRSPVPTGTSFPARLRFVQDRFIETVEKNREVHITLERLQFSAAMAEHFRSKLETTRALVRALLRQGVEEGFVPTEKLEKYVTYFMALADGLLRHWSLLGGDQSIRELMDEMVDFFLRGARA